MTFNPFATSDIKAETYANQAKTANNEAYKQDLAGNAEAARKAADDARYASQQTEKYARRAAYNK